MRHVGIHEVIYTTGEEDIYKIEKLSTIKYGHISSGNRHWHWDDYKFRKYNKHVKT